MSEGTLGIPESRTWPLAVELPWPPSVNTYYRHVVVRGHARTLLSAGGRAYKLAVAGRMIGRVAPPGRHAVRIVLYPPTRARIDLDNRLKSLLDAVYEALGLDDEIIDQIGVARGTVVRGGMAWLVIEEADR